MDLQNQSVQQTPLNSNIQNGANNSLTEPSFFNKYKRIILISTFLIIIVLLTASFYFFIYSRQESKNNPSQLNNQFKVDCIWSNKFFSQVKSTDLAIFNKGKIIPQNQAYVLGVIVPTQDIKDRLTGELAVYKAEFDERNPAGGRRWRDVIGAKRDGKWQKWELLPQGKTFISLINHKNKDSDLLISPGYYNFSFFQGDKVISSQTCIVGDIQKKYKYILPNFPQGIPKYMKI